jgi:hypothetical protein
MQPELSYTQATEPELNELLAGKEAGISFLWPSYSKPPHLPPGLTGVVWKRGNHSDDPIRPFALVAREQEFRRLCGRFAQVRSDLSPLTAWCHLLTPDRFDLFDSPVREGDLGGLEAAWTGLVIAEALLLSEKALSNLRFPACLATQSFAIARAEALWGNLSDKDSVARFGAANRLFRNESVTQRGGEARTERVRTALEPIWNSLSAILRGENALPDGELRPILASLRGLQLARQHKDLTEARRLAGPLLHSVPEAQQFMQLQDLAPEQRLKIFDELIGNLNAMNPYKQSLRQVALALLSGYLATVAAGGIPTLSLAEGNGFRRPEVVGWAYVVGGIGERVVWTSSFDGLGRLVARELMRPFRIDEPPTCDFALDEASVLVDPKLPDPLVHLRLKQGRIATITLLPGVNVAIPVADPPTPETRPQSTQSARQTESVRDSRGVMALIADAIWPHIRPRVEECIRTTREDSSESPNYSRPRNKRKPSASQLALKDSKK